MRGRFNGWAPWIGIVLVLVTNIVMVTWAFGKVSARADWACEQVAELKTQRDKLQALMMEVSQRTARIEGMLATHMDQDKRSQR